MPPSDDGTKPPQKRRASTDKLKKLTGTLPLERLTKTQVVTPKAPLDKTPMLTDEEAARARQKVLAMQAAATPARRPGIDPAMLRTQQLSPEEQQKATALLKLVYLEMFGHDMSWAAFHVLEVMSSPKYLQKRVGYLGAVQSFRPDTEVLMLATNLLKKVGSKF